MSLRQMWNATLAEPVPQELLDVIEGAAEFALPSDERGEAPPEPTDGGPDGSTDAPRKGSR